MVRATSTYLIDAAIKHYQVSVDPSHLESNALCFWIEGSGSDLEFLGNHEYAQYPDSEIPDLSFPRALLQYLKFVLAYFEEAVFNSIPIHSDAVINHFKPTIPYTVVDFDVSALSIAISLAKLNGVPRVLNELANARVRGSVEIGSN